MKKVLVLGSTGAMGRYLVPELVKLGYAVTGVSLDNAIVTGENITHDVLSSTRSVSS